MYVSYHNPRTIFPVIHFYLSCSASSCDDIIVSLRSFLYCVKKQRYFFALNNICKWYTANFDEITLLRRTQPNTSIPQHASRSVVIFVWNHCSSKILGYFFLRASRFRCFTNRGDGTTKLFRLFFHPTASFMMSSSLTRPAVSTTASTKPRIWRRVTCYNMLPQSLFAIERSTTSNCCAICTKPNNTTILARPEISDDTSYGVSVIPL